jgi:hypothetical protein
MDYAAKLKPRTSVVLSLLVEFDVIELGYKLQCIAHLVEKKRKQNLANTVVELFELCYSIELCVYVRLETVGEHIVHVPCEETSKVKNWTKPAGIVCGLCECVVVIEVDEVICGEDYFANALVASFEKVV